MPPSKLSESKTRLKAKTTSQPTIEEQLETVSQPLTATSPLAATIPNSSITSQFKTYEDINLPTFDPQTFLANDLFSDSSPLPKTDKLEADKLIQSISQKRETLRVVGANLSLNTDALKTGSLSEKMSQAGLDYSSAKIGTDIKLVGLESQKVSYAIAVSKFGQVSEKLAHENITLEGLRLETDQRRRFWAEKYALGESRINQVQLAKYQLDAKIGAIETEAESITE